MAIRTVKYGGYSLMSDFHLKDGRLSWKAKGFLSALLCLSGEYRIDELLRLASDGHITDGSGEVVAELVKYGYLKISKYGNEAEYVVYEKPFVEESSQMPMSEIPYAEDVPGKPISVKCSEEEIERLRESLHLKAVAKECSEKFVELVFRELCRRDAEFRQIMTAEAFKRVCLITWECRNGDPFYKEHGNIVLINRYLDAIVAGIRSAGGGNEPTTINRPEVGERHVNK